MSSKRVVLLSFFFKTLLFWVVLALSLSEHVTADWEEHRFWGLGPLVKRNQRETIISTEDGDFSEARVTDGNETFQLHFITLEPNSLFLPVVLHSDMVFYVHTGSGRLSYQDEDEKEHRRLRRGNVHRLRSGTVFFIQSDLAPERQKLRIVAIFDNSEYDFNEPASGPYSSIRDVVLGFDKKVLQATIKVPEQVIEEITNGTKPPAIIHGLQKKKDTIWQMEYEIMEDVYNILGLSNKHKKSKLFNIFDEDPDFENCNGWSTTVNKKKYGPLKGSKFGIFMVNLTTGSMMGPHWNPMATEIAVVLQGKGMIRVVCPSFVKESECKNTRFGVEEGDVFVVPRFHPMAQMAFNNETFVFMGFSTSVKKNHPQYLAGKASVLRTLDKHVLATSFGVNDATFEKLLAQQDDSVILDCTSCAEEEWRRMEEEIEKERQKEKEREEEEARRKEEEQRREEEEARKKEEEKAKRKEEEAQKKREEEEAQRREQEEREKEEEKQQEQEEREAQEREEEEAQKKREEEEAQKKREEEEAKRREEEERERQEQQQREQEEREAQEREEEEAQKKREEEEAKRREEEERERQEQLQREQEEREAQEREEEEAQKKREEEEAKRREEEERERQEQQQREQEEREAQEREEEEAQKKREEEEAKRRREEEERERQEQQQREQEEREAHGRREAQEQAREAEKERKAEARREDEAAKQAEARLEEEAAKHEEEAARRWEQAHGRREGGRATRSWKRFRRTSSQPRKSRAVTKDGREE